MEYGYSLAGVVTSVGAGVDAAGWVGSRVFCFAPHASAHCLDPEGGALRKIPRGIDLQDAVFLPAVETVRLLKTVKLLKTVRLLKTLSR